MTNPSHWIYLSPHLDDAVLSCGGIVWEQVQLGAQVEIWTVFAGDPPTGDLTPFARSLHARWQSGQDSAAARRREDVTACAVLGARYRHFDLPDCIYRLDETGQPVIKGEEDLFQPGYQGEEDLTHCLTEKIARELPPDAILAVPYGFGNHIDHQLVRRTASRLDHCVWLYADFPYSAANTGSIHTWMNFPGKSFQLAVTAGGLIKWQEAVAAYETQISTFWASLEVMRQKISGYCQTGVGSLLHQVGSAV